MHGDSQVAGIESMTIGQLEGRLELAMAVSRQLVEQRTVNRANVLVAMESIGLELPAHLPLASFTRHPSQTNYRETAELIRQEELALQKQMAVRTRVELRKSLESIVQHIRRDAPPYEPQYKLLTLVSSYLQLVNLDNVAADHPNALVQEELAKIADAMSHWQPYNELGQKTIEFDGLYQRAHALWERVGGALSNMRELSSSKERHSLLNDVEGFVSTVAWAAHVEAEDQWSPYQLVEKTLKFMESFSGAIPFKLQERVGSVQELLDGLEEIEDYQILQNNLIAAKALDTYLSWCWRLEQTRSQAVVSSLLVCRSVGHLRELTA